MMKTSKTNYRSLRELAAAIHAVERNSIFEIGAPLIEAKAGHPGEFLTGLASDEFEVEYSEDTAERWMNVARLDQKFRNLRNLKVGKTTLYIVRLLEDDEYEHLTADQLMKRVTTRAGSTITKSARKNCSTRPSQTGSTSTPTSRPLITNRQVPIRTSPEPPSSSMMC
jgi:hypothetical protein